ERQLEISARSRRRAGYDANCTAGCIGFHLLDSGDAMQLSLVALFDADFSHLLGTAVIGEFAVSLQSFQILVIDASYVTHHVRGEAAFGILAERPRLDFHSRKAIAVDGEAGDLHVR